MTWGLTRQCRRRLYNGSPGPRLWRVGAVIGVLAVALASGGCSMSYQLSSYDFGSMFGGGSKSDAKSDVKADITGSIGSGPGAKTDAKPGTQTAAVLPPEDDLAYAKAAVSRLLALGKKYTSLPWENPTTGARGTITPITSAYSAAGGQTCRDFLASYIKGTSEAWLQGEACKHHTGPWQVRSMKPWKSS